MGSFGTKLILKRHLILCELGLKMLNVYKSVESDDMRLRALKEQEYIVAKILSIIFEKL